MTQNRNLQRGGLLRWLGLVFVVQTILRRRRVRR